MAKLYDLAVKIGSYEKNGETKNKYENVGVVMSGEHGPYIILKRTFNPAGIGEGESIFISMFEPRKKEDDAGKLAPSNPMDGETVDDAPPPSDIDNPFDDTDLPL